MRKKICDLLSVICLLAGAACLFLGWKEQKPYRESDMEQEALREIAVVQAAGETEEQSLRPTKKLPLDPWERQIDFQSLKKINSDIVAWVTLPGTAIDYPVLIGRNDNEYLKKNFRGRKSSLGSVFSFSDAAKDFSDAHVCLFGHNMRTARMFGELKKYKEKSFAKQHPKLYCYTPEGVTEYEWFSAYECEKTDETFQHRMQKNSPEFFHLYQRMQEKNQTVREDTGSGVTAPDNRQLLTLSCCSDYNRTKKRMTVHFIETKKRGEECEEWKP